ncbi:caax amino terminal protease family [Indibacter alkaliphilus LW1]|jgi:membrane protease YdiL (CAAX protease family)|uniref:Caax amino terminal protease family n=1 Tax=Indibacter alkaliphilus (strain CCUG 57479 / KCTC 22604 / LW1) TaxID=1189612 RepID=S2DBG4_INDAL|nr:CPBP family intramembrane glutamic endopeptidase [Indibacter alkaliphilus]EOZ96517.1 caax amino terminal protease family [Indibacter alkaliphilus LW1]
MQIYKTQAPIASPKFWLLSFFIMLLVVVGVMALLQGITVFLIPPLYNIPLDELAALLTNPDNYEQGRQAFLLIQGVGTGFAFFVAALLIAKLVDRADFGMQQQVSRYKFTGLLLMFMVMIGAILFNSLLIDINMGIKLPEFMSGIESWMRNKEDELMYMTKFITDFQSTGEFLAGVLVIGVLAGLGEEVFFRGVLQPKIQIYTGNPHVAVWLTAFIFSAIHMQFYGFLPRLLLGAVFGYLYIFSGSMIYPIIAHILNNTFTVVLVYLNKLGKIEFDLEETGQVSVLYAIIGLVLMVFALKVFNEHHNKKEINEKLAENI